MSGAKDYDTGDMENYEDESYDFMDTNGGGGEDTVEDGDEDNAKGKGKPATSTTAKGGGAGPKGGVRGAGKGGRRTPVMARRGSKGFRSPGRSTSPAKQPDIFRAKPNNGESGEQEKVLTSSAPLSLKEQKVLDELAHLFSIQVTIYWLFPSFR
jgi:hypothetical protein